MPKTKKSKTEMTTKTLVSGTAVFSQTENKEKSVGFTPKTSTNKMIKGFCGDAYLTTSPDGQFLVKLRRRQQGNGHIIKLLAHGRLSRTLDQAVQLTIKIFHPEDQDVAGIILHESWEAAAAYNELTAN